MRKFTEKKLVLATHNKGKVRELAELLAPFDMQVMSAAGLGLDEPEETGQTFVENARIKSLNAARASSLPALSDDSGMVIPILDGQPGIYSARWAGADKNYSVAIDKIKELLLAKTGEASGNLAHFVCALSLAFPDGKTLDFEGKIHGTLTFPPRGGTGFGYDPIFIPNGHDLTFAEMEPAQKHKISHRAKAFNKLIRDVF